MKIKLVLVILLSWCACGASAQKLGVYSMAFYNVENLFDTRQDSIVPDEEFHPNGAYVWTPEKYQKKLDNVAKVISQLGCEYCPAGAAVIGVAEVENRGVLEDLVANNSVVERGYKIVHYDSPDRRGIDVGLLYNPNLFTVTSSHPYPFNMPAAPEYVTRDQLLVSGILGGEPVHVIVCHWPSRYGGDASEPYRAFAASITRHIVDSLRGADPRTKVVIMGDLNDDPKDNSCKVVLNAKKKRADCAADGLFNTTWKLYDGGVGSLGYQGKWNLFDQIIVSSGLLGDDRASLKLWKTEIFNRDFLIQHQGKDKGYPHRTFSGNTFIDGYSDHFPVIVYLVKKIE